jgi:hypothetical protein
MQDEYGGGDECEEYGDQVDIVDPGGDDFEDPNEHAEGSTGIFIYIMPFYSCDISHSCGPSLLSVVKLRH